MGSVDLKVAGVVVATIGLYTLIANVIPQVQSEVPEVLAFGANVSTEELVAAGDGLFHGAGGCTACHSEAPGARAPNLLTDYRGEGPIGARCGTRIEGMTCKEYLFMAVTLPTDHLVDDFPPIMPPLDRTMTPPQVWSVIAFLESNGGDVTVTGADIPAAPAPGEGGAPVPATGAGGVPMIAGTDPAEIVQMQCQTCHMIAGQGAPVGPALDGVGGRIGAEGIRHSILDPSAEAAPGFEALVNMMPPNFGERLTAIQLEGIVQYLANLP